MRSKLFVPAIRPELFPKALGSAADAICFDLEDAVPAERKSEARENLNTFLSSLTDAHKKRLLVRVNAVDSVEFEDDLRAAVRTGIDAIALPKVETVAEVRQAELSMAAMERARRMRSQVGLLLTIESPRGLRCAAELALCSSRICGLQLGFADLLEPLGIASDNFAAQQQIRLMLRFAAGEAGVSCYEAAYPFVNDDAGFLARIKDARAFGFAGASCIHPKQIEAANREFTPTADEVRYAESVVAAAEQADRDGKAVVVVDGKMIDRPFILRARAILDQRANGVAD
jgi:citrate lyase subunit beta/citryl-CoA lyase